MIVHLPVLVAILQLFAGSAGTAAILSAADTTTAMFDLSGLTVIHRLDPGSDIVAVRLFLLGGTRQLTPATAGIEALALRATHLETGNLMAATGGRSILEPGPDWTVTGFVALKREFPAAWNVLARRIVQPRFSDEAVDRARGELLSLARRRYAHPDLRVQALAWEGAFEGHPYAIDPLGTIESLAGLEAEDLETYVTKQFVTSRMLLVIVGDVDRKTVRSLVTGTFGTLARGSYEWILPPPAPQRSAKWKVEHRPLSTNYVLGYFTGPSPTEDDFFAFQVATEVLSSRIFTAVRNLASLSYAAYAPYIDAAVPVGGIYASTAEPAEVVNDMARQIGVLRDLGIHPFALKHFLNRYTLDQLASNVTNDGQAQRLGRAFLYFGDYEIADRYDRLLRRVSPEDVRRIAQDYMPALQLAFLGDTTRMRSQW